MQCIQTRAVFFRNFILVSLTYMRFCLYSICTFLREITDIHLFVSKQTWKRAVLLVLHQNNDSNKSYFIFILRCLIRCPKIMSSRESPSLNGNAVRCFMIQTSSDVLKLTSCPNQTVQQHTLFSTLEARSHWHRFAVKNESWWFEATWMTLLFDKKIIKSLLTLNVLNVINVQSPNKGKLWHMHGWKWLFALTCMK